MFHVSACSPFEGYSCIKERAKILGYEYINVPRYLNGDRLFLHIKKLLWVLDEIKNNDILKNSIILCTDAHDILVLSSNEEILSRFLRKNVDFCISGEGYFHPNNEDEYSYRKGIRQSFENGSQHPYPNAGAWIGYGWAAMEVLSQAARYAEENNLVDDQWCIQDVIYRNDFGNTKIGVDFNQYIFTSAINNLDKIHFIGPKIFVGDKNESVAVCHFNGHRHKLDFFKFYNKIYTEARCDDLFIRKIVSSTGEFINQKEGSFYKTNYITDHSIFVLSAPSGNSCLINTLGEVMTLFPDGSVSFGYSRVDTWEILKTNNVIEIISHLSGDKVHFEMIYVDDVCQTQIHNRTNEILSYYHNI